ncbi:primosomal protein DnaI [Nicoliella lavandulae]|uniref:Primosomal protein DnaI n=1 Tax=Nicoliella lavandulae TaxID=3082954 RepID=A0ABU8SKS8_9LACO
MKDLKTELRHAINDKFGDKFNYQSLMREAYNDPDVQAFVKAHSISNESIRRSASKIYEYVQQKNKSANHDGLIPGYHPKLVYNGQMIDVTYVPTLATIEKQKSKQLKERVKSIAMPKVIQNASLNDFDYKNKYFSTRSPIMVYASNFTSDYPETDHFIPGMYISGSFGIGKTFLIGAIANELAEDGISSLLVHFPSFAHEMKESISDNTGGAKLDAVKKAPILMLDDIGADSISDWVRDEVLGLILEYRMQNELPTFFTSNYTIDDLKDAYLSGRNNDETRANRIVERIRFLSREFQMQGDNRRRK